MTSLEALARLQKIGVDVFRTADAAIVLGMSNSTASRALARLASTGHLLDLSHNLWGLPDKVSLLSLPRYLAAPFPCYVSLQSALYFHGMVSQIPVTLYVVTIGRTGTFKTSLGSVSFHHITPGFFFGFERSDESGMTMATPEKALLDFCYLKFTRSNLFTTLPELEIPRNFNAEKAWRMVERIPSKRQRTIVEKAFGELLSVPHYHTS